MPHATAHATTTHVTYTTDHIAPHTTTRIVDATTAYVGKVMTPANGIVLWTGKSLLDGAPIAMIATGLASASSNGKTGAMIQTWIIRTDIAPHLAIKTGDDASVCGGCVHRGTATGESVVDRTCYVVAFQAPLAVFKAYHRGVYSTARTSADIVDAGEDRAVRLGSYGDPAAVPSDVLFSLTSKATNHTGYTHQWRSFAFGSILDGLLMASVDTREEQAEAQHMGWRTFRVAPLAEGVNGTTAAIKTTHGTAFGETLCPASEEGGKRTTCADCGLCKGTATAARSIVIPAHGMAKKKVK